MQSTNASGPEGPKSLVEPGKSKERKSAPATHVEYSVFSKGMRRYLTYLLGLAAALSTLTATIYFPLIPLLSKRLDVSVQAINLTITVYVVVQAVSPGIFASLADTIGRRPVVLALVTLYLLATLGLVVCFSVDTTESTYAALMTLRALQSVGGSVMPALGYGITYDIMPMSERGSMLGPMMGFCNGFSAIGPVVGGAIAQSTDGVQWVFTALLGVAATCLLLAGFTMPETARHIVGNGSHPASGIWKPWTAVWRGKVFGLPVPIHEDGIIRLPKWQPLRTLDSFRIILHPKAAVVLWMIAASYTVYYTFQVAIPVIFAEVYGFNELQIGLITLPGLIGMTLGGLLAGKLLDHNFAVVSKRLGVDAERRTSSMPLDFPLEQARYRGCHWFLLWMSALVVGYGWAVHARVHAAVPAVLQTLICASSTLLSHTASALIVDMYPDMPSTAYASAQIVRCGLSALSSAVLQPFVEAVGRGWYFTAFAMFIGLSGLASMIVSRTYGARWRGNA